MHTFTDRKRCSGFGIDDKDIKNIYTSKKVDFISSLGTLGIAANRIDEIKEDKLGNIYFNNGGEISKFDGQNFIKVSTASNSNNEWKLEPDDLWFKGNQNSGLVYRYDGKYLHRLKFPETKELRGYDGNPEPRARRQLGILQRRLR